jgi:hypothetical protein
MKYQQEVVRLASSGKLCRRAGKQRCRHTIPGYGGDSAEHACMGMFGIICGGGGGVEFSHRRWIFSWGT